VNFRTNLFLAVTTVAGLLFIGSPSSASQFLDIDVGPYRFNVPADSFGVPPAVLINIGLSNGPPAPFKYMGVQSNPGTPNFVFV
jgi:hypothetical protein